MRAADRFLRPSTIAWLLWTVLIIFAAMPLIVRWVIGPSVWWLVFVSDAAIVLGILLGRWDQQRRSFTAHDKGSAGSG